LQHTNFGVWSAEMFYS